MYTVLSRVILLALLRTKLTLTRRTLVLSRYMTTSVRLTCQAACLKKPILRFKRQEWRGNDSTFASGRIHRHQSVSVATTVVKTAVVITAHVANRKIEIKATSAFI